MSGQVGSGDGERGETLLELVIAVAILGVAMVAILGGLFTSILVSGLHRDQANAGEYIRDYAEAIENKIAGGSYVACATNYSPGYTPPAGYTAQVKSVRYWTGSAWSTTCGTDTGLQQLTLKMTTPDSRVTETLVIVVRKPCGPGVTICS